MKEEIKYYIEIPEDTEIKIDKFIVNIKGKKGEITRNLVSRKIHLKIEDKKIIIFPSLKLAIISTF